MINSKQKGKAGELEAVRVLKEHGFSDARRGQQFKGTPDSPDIICPSLGAFHFEVKRTERLNLYDAIGQAEKDAGDSTPVVMHRKNNHKWVAILHFDDFVDIVKETDLIRPKQKTENELAYELYNVGGNL